MLGVKHLGGLPDVLISARARETVLKSKEAEQRSEAGKRLPV